MEWLSFLKAKGFISIEKEKQRLLTKDILRDCLPVIKVSQFELQRDLISKRNLEKEKLNAIMY